MAKSSIDCHFFLTGACRNGDGCPFRHSEGARNTEEVCPEFAESGHCSALDCGKRHAEVKRAPKPPSEVPCRNEENNGSCTRPDCIFKHTKAHGTLNAGAKVFVPRSRAARPDSSGMEWTPDSSAPKAAQPRPFGNKEWIPGTSSIKPDQTRSFGNMEWTPSAAAKPAAQPSQPQLFGNKEWTPAAANKPTAQPRTFGNKEWTPNTATKPATQPQLFGNKEWTPADAANSTPAQTFGNKEWTPNSQLEPVQPQPQTFGNKEWPSAASIKPTAQPRTFGNKEWTPNASSEPAQPQTFGNKGWPSNAPSQPAQTRMFGNKEWTPAAATMPTEKPQTFGNREWTPASKPKSKPKEPTGPIQSIYDILGIVEQNPDSSIEKHTRENHQLRNPHQQREAVDRPVSNSPVSRVCYASEFPSYFSEHEESQAFAGKAEPEASIGEPEQEPSYESKMPMEAVEPEPSYVPEIPMVQLEPEPKSEPNALAEALELEPESENAPTPEPELNPKPQYEPKPKPEPTTNPPLIKIKNTLQLPDIELSDEKDEKPVPKVLSFQEIMERKRRKNTAAAAAAAAAEAAKELVVDAEPTKRNLPEEDAGMNSDASEGKRIKVKNYVEMFEKELENLNAELSGPLENTPSTDRISKAAIADTIEYI